jgi:hypothetical protein
MPTKDENEIFEIYKVRDQIKNQYCQENGMKILHIPYWEAKNVNKILKMHLLTYSK